jgi:hypothetical protein
MRTTGKRVAIAAALAAVAVVVLGGIILQDWIIEWLPRREALPPFPKMSDEGERFIQARKAKILAEIEALGGRHPWAGEYFAGNGLGRNFSLWIAPRAGFAYEWHGCVGLYDRNCGKVLQGSRLKLRCRFPNDDDDFHVIAEIVPAELIPLAWGERMYLLAPTEVIGFCNAYNAGWEPRKLPLGQVFLRRGDQEKAADGSPPLLGPFAKYLLKEPLVVRIAAIDGIPKEEGAPEERRRTTTVAIDAGSAEGVFEEMWLFPVEADAADIVDGFEVVKVAEHSSKATVEQYESSSTKKLPPGPQVGWKLSTRPRATAGR